MTYWLRIGHARSCPINVLINAINIYNTDGTTVTGSNYSRNAYQKRFVMPLPKCIFSTNTPIILDHWVTTILVNHLSM